MRIAASIDGWYFLDSEGLWVGPHEAEGCMNSSDDDDAQAELEKENR